MTNINFFQILGLEPGASDEEIKSAYRKLSKKFHPDLNNGDTFFEAKFKEINEAHEVLSDPIKKAQYLNFIKFSEGEKSNDSNQTKDESNKTDNHFDKEPDKDSGKFDKYYWLFIIIPIFIIIGLIKGEFKKSIREKSINDIQNNQVEFAAADTTMASNEKIDTIYRNFELIKFNDEVFLGMDKYDWNKSLSRSTENNFFSKLEYYTYGMIGLSHRTEFYKAFKLLDSLNYIGYWFEPLLISNKNTDKKKYFINKVGGKIVEDSILCGVLFKYNVFNSFSQICSEINRLKNEFKLSYYTGVENTGDYLNPLTDQEIGNGFEDYNSFIYKTLKGLSKDKSFVDDKFLNKEPLSRLYTSSFSKNSVYENMDYYCILEVETGFLADVLRNSEFEILSVKNFDIRDFTLSVSFIGKKYPHEDILKYSTLSQKAIKEENDRTQSLINKAK